VGGEGGLEEVVFGGEAVGEEFLADEAVFARGEDVVSELEIVAVVIDERKGQHERAPPTRAGSSPGYRLAACIEPRMALL